MPSLRMNPQRAPIEASNLVDLIEVHAEELSRQLKPKAVDTYRYQLAPFVEWWEGYAPANDYLLTRESLLSFTYWLEHEHKTKRGQPLASATRSSICHRVRQFLRWLHASDRLDINIAKWVRLPKVRHSEKKTLSVGQLQRLFDATQGCQQIRDVALLAFLVDTGARRNEVACALIENLDLENRTCYLEITKTEQPRTVVFSRKCACLLDLYLCATEKTSGPIFGLAGSGIRQVVRRLGERAGVNVSPHVFRRTFATHWMQNFKGDGSVAKLLLKIQLGHTTGDMTESHYIMLTPQDVKDNYLSPLSEVRVRCRPPVVSLEL